MINWSTDGIPPRERFDYWREVVCKTVFDVSTESQSDRFSARINGRSVGDVRFVSFDCTGHEIVRNWRQIESKPEDYYVVTLHLRGRSQFSQGNETMSLRPSEIAIVDGRLPFRITFSDVVSRAVAVIPHAKLDGRAPWLKSRPRRKIAPVSEFADMARQHLRMLASEDNDLSDSQSTMLTDNLCNLLALATRDTAPNRLEPSLMLEGILAYCKQNLHNMDLKPQLVAARFGISVRTLHLRFEELGHTFGRWLLENRLEASSKALREPEQRTASISQIAYGTGFNDLSHFNRTFRARYGVSPSQWRSTPSPRRQPT
jgi:AraC-like DNA-binding protein